MGAGIVTAGRRFISSAVGSVVIAVVIMEFMSADPAALRQEIPTFFFQFNVAEAH